jgi:hypothetical protein
MESINSSANLNFENTKQQEHMQMFVEIDGYLGNNRNINISDALLLATHLNNNNSNNITTINNKNSKKLNKKRKVTAKNETKQAKSEKAHFFNENLFTTNTYFKRDFASTSNLAKNSLFFDTSTNSFGFTASESSQRRLLRMTKKLEELNLNSSLFMASSSSWTSLHKSNSFLYLDNKFHNNDTTQHAKLAFYNQLLSNKGGRKDNFNYQKLSSDFSHVSEKNKSYMHLKELLGYPDSFKQSSEASYDSEPDEANTQRRGKNDSKSHRQDNSDKRRHISIKHFASVESKYKSTPENLNNLGKPASFLNVRPSNLNGNQKNLFKIEESYKDSSNSIYAKLDSDAKNDNVKRTHEPKIKSKKNSFRHLQQYKKSNSKGELNMTTDNKNADIFLHPDKLDSERLKIKNSFPNLFSNKKKPLMPSDFMENSGLFSMGSNNSLANPKKRTPLNIANFDKMSLMSKYNLNHSVEEAFKFTKLLENRSEKSSTDAFRLKFENCSNKNDLDGTLDEAGKESTSLDYEEIPSEINNNKVPINTHANEKTFRVNFFPSIVPPPPSVETSLSTANNNNFKSQAFLNFKNFE